MVFDTTRIYFFEADSGATLQQHRKHRDHRERQLNERGGVVKNGRLVGVESRGGERIDGRIGF